MTTEKKKKEYQLNPGVYTDGDRIDRLHVMPPVSGNKQNLETKQNPVNTRTGHFLL